MIEKPALPPHFQFSVRATLLGTAILAVLLVPIAWVFHQREQMRIAREEAIRAVVMAERSRSEIEKRATIDEGINQPVTRSHTPAVRIKELEQENAGLKDKVDLLEREVDRLKGRNR